MKKADSKTASTLGEEEQEGLGVPPSVASRGRDNIGMNKKKLLRLLERSFSVRVGQYKPRPFKILVAEPRLRKSRKEKPI